MSVPPHWNEAGLTIGVQFVAKFNNDACFVSLRDSWSKSSPGSSVSLQTTNEATPQTDEPCCAAQS
jgi:hypothetical protein